VQACGLAMHLPGGAVADPPRGTTTPLPQAPAQYSLARQSAFFTQLAFRTQVTCQPRVAGSHTNCGCEPAVQSTAGRGIAEQSNSAARQVP